MDPNKDDTPDKTAEDLDQATDSISAEENQAANSPNQDAPADALNRTPDELADEQAEAASQQPTSDGSKKSKVKKPSKIKALLKKVNVYLLMFLLVLVVAGAIAAVSYINSQKEPEVPAIAGQELTQEALQDLANTDVSIGSSSQTLNIQGSAVIDGQVLMRSNLNVAGNLQAGGSIQGSELTISGRANLGETQVNSLQVAQNTAIEGSTTLRDLSVSGTASFGGAMTASQITVSRLILSGNASLEIPNHIRFSGPTPGRSIMAGALGGGGSASVNGSDTSGTVNINTGNGPRAGCMVRVNFSQAFSNQPHVIVSPVGAAAGRTQYYVDRDQTGFSICASSAAPANQSMAFDYFVTN